jgi:hypothetical protein
MKVMRLPKDAPSARFPQVNSTKSKKKKELGLANTLLVSQKVFPKISSEISALTLKVNALK